MEFGSQEHHFTINNFIPSPSSSSSSSSLHNPHNKMSTASWLATKYEPEPEPEDHLTSRSNTSFGTPQSKLDFMDLVNEDKEQQEETAPIEKEHMFDKVVTPSDVGKLNRLVIPKQRAEKYFPLDSTANEKGLLLNFEDRTGKAWRFRYSYWNSSQSYVMTKGWSRFVKDKKLDAGDIVSFQRGIGDTVKDRFFIDWRHRPDSAADCNPNRRRYLSSFPWSPLLMRPPEVVYVRSAPPSPVAQWPRIGGGSGGGLEPMVYESVPVVVEGKAAAKRLRLFGVNLDCPFPTESEHQLSSSSLQLKLFNGSPIHKGESSVSLDLDI